MKSKFELIKFVTVVALIRFELRFVVASSRCRVGAFTCALASERVIARCMLMVMTSHCLPFYCTTSAFVNRNSFFLFLDTKQSTLLFFFQHSSLKLLSSNVKYFCLFLFNNYFCIFIRILVLIHL